MKITTEPVIDLLHLAANGTLATYSMSLPGYPYATAVPHAPDDAHRPVFCVSALAEHTRNMLTDARVSYAVIQPSAQKVQSAPRLTVVGDVERFDPCAALIERFIRYQPETEELLSLDFSFFRLCPRRVRYIGGLGKMGWLDGTGWLALATLAPDDEQRILRELSTEQTSRSRVLGVDRYGIDIELDGRRQRHRFPNAPLNTGDISLIVHRMLSALP